MPNLFEEAWLIEAKNTISNSITKAKGHDGIISHDKIHIALQGTNKVVKQARAFLKQNDAPKVIELCLLIINKMDEMWYQSNDFDNKTSALIMTAIKMMEQLLKQYENKAIPSTVFRRLLEEAKNPQYECEYEIQSPLIELCLFAARTPKEEIQLDHYLKIIVGHPSPSDEPNEGVEHATLLRLMLMMNQNKAKEFSALVDQYIYMDSVRTFVLEAALRSADYEGALILAQQGEDHHKNRPETASFWQIEQLKILANLKDHPRIRVVAIKLAIQGLQSAYMLLKETYSEHEWNMVVDDVLDQIKDQVSDPEIYQAYLIIEKDMNRLFQSVQEHIFTVPKHIQQLKAADLIKACAIYRQYILNFAQSANKQTAYRKLNELIFKYAKIADFDAAIQLREELRHLYHNRNDMLKELSNVKTKSLN